MGVRWVMTDADMEEELRGLTPDANEELEQARAREPTLEQHRRWLRESRFPDRPRGLTATGTGGPLW